MILTISEAIALKKMIDMDPVEPWNDLDIRCNLSEGYDACFKFFATEEFPDGTVKNPNALRDLVGEWFYDHLDTPRYIFLLADSSAPNFDQQLQIFRWVSGGRDVGVQMVACSGSSWLESIYQEEKELSDIYSILKNPVKLMKKLDSYMVDCKVLMVDMSSE